MFLQHIRECLRYANDCAHEAKVSSDPRRRLELLDMQLRWLSIARGYEFSERLEFLSGIEARNNDARQMIEKTAA
jgi:hypothetical protein